MTKKKSFKPLSIEWREIDELKSKYEDVHLSDEWIMLIHAEHHDHEILYVPNMWIENKLAWFLTNGSAGVLYLVLYIWGIDGLEIFLDFVKWYIYDYDSPGHFHPSRALKTSINENQGSIDKTNIKQLKELLIDFSKNFAFNDGVKEASGWKSDKD